MARTRARSVAPRSDGGRTLGGVNKGFSALVGHGFEVGRVRATANVTNDSDIEIPVNVPFPSLILGYAIRVKETISHEWNWDFIDGNTILGDAAAQSEVTGSVIEMLGADPTDYHVTTESANILIRRDSNPGVDDFDAGGSIEAVVYYIQMDEL